jgi:hypothetical protein
MGSDGQPVGEALVTPGHLTRRLGALLAAAARGRALFRYPLTTASARGTAARVPVRR